MAFIIRPKQQRVTLKQAQIQAMKVRIVVLEAAIRNLITLPNVENRCGEWKDVNEAIKSLCRLNV